jgi:hypothetical protein
MTGREGANPKTFGKDFVPNSKMTWIRTPHQQIVTAMDRRWDLINKSTSVTQVGSCQKEHQTSPLSEPKPKTLRASKHVGRVRVLLGRGSGFLLDGKDTKILSTCPPHARLTDRRLPSAVVVSTEVKRSWSIQEKYPLLRKFTCF